MGLQTSSKDLELDREAAVITAVRLRLRPILMTTAATVLGVVIADGAGAGASTRAP